ncbi:MAG: methionine--tRNA ligase [Deltaproteobacteria bacterium]|nr:methionine--tRNA ligase [Deltaproteobacteria bacterium]
MPHRRPILVTMALPYANGPIHLGHLVEAIQTDIYVRFLRSIGEDAVYICADDTHGTPIELNARAQGVTPEELVERFGAEHRASYAAFDISFDYYSSTNTSENRAFAEEFYARLKAGGFIESRTLEFNFCESCRRFLPDRFVRGTCPKCKAPDQYGDVCERCNSTYGSTELVDPRCAICGATPVRRPSTHEYFKLSMLGDWLRTYVATPGVLQDEIKNFVDTWLKDGLRDWCISRDGPYFGFPIPGLENKYFYVWLDAPIGYVSSTARYCRESGRNFEAYWRKGAEIIHFIGKDIVYFHTLFWPAMLKVAAYTLPARVVVHGMLTVNGEKMSKSRGTFITAREYLDKLDPTYLRYYFAASLSNRPDDLDLSLRDLKNRVNAELVGNIANLANRVLSFAQKRFGGALTALPADERSTELVRAAEARYQAIEAAYRDLDFRRAVREINALADLGNKYIQDSAPWDLVNQNRDEAMKVITLGANIVRLLAIAMAPITPKLAHDLERQLGVERLSWRDGKFDFLHHTIRDATPLIPRVEDEALQALVVGPPAPAPAPAPASAPAPAPASAPAPAPASASASVPAKPTITIDDFAKVDLRVGVVVAAEPVPKAEKLLKLSVDVGTETRTVVAGIAKAYAAADIIGKRVVIVANLAPARLMGVESQGMLLAAGPGGSDLTVAEFARAVAPGTRVK